MKSKVQTLNVLPALMLLLLLCFVCSRIALANPAFTPVYHPEMKVSKAVGEIKIDGKLDDPGWTSAARADNFAEHQPGDQTKPPVETVAFMTYDDDNLYVSFICYDDPNAVRASMCERERVFDDDNICLCLDTYGDAAWAYTLNVNPYGIQADALWSANNHHEDQGFDLIWESAGTITDAGYQVEMAIPFSSLRFPSEEDQQWKVDFWRNHPRESRRQYSWAAYDRNENCWPCQWGTITGIENVRPGKGIEIMPTMIGYQSGSLRGAGSPDEPFSFDNQAARGEVSLGGKYSVSSDVTVEAAYNPDFSQVEADAGQINVNTTFALFYPERRPFFQEGSDLFRVLFNSFYTRSVNDPEFATKVTARSGRNGFGYLVARDEHSPIIVPFEEYSVPLLIGKSTTNVLRARRSIASGSQLGFIATDRRYDGGGSGSVISHDGRLRFTPSLNLSYQAIVSHYEEPDDPTITPSWMQNVVFWDDHTAAFDGESFWGHGGIGVLSYWTETWNANINYWEVSPTYRADNGYDPKNNRRDLTVNAGYNYRPESNVFDIINPQVSASTVWNYDGKKKQEFVSLAMWTRLKVAQASAYAQYFRCRESVGGVQFDDIWSVHYESNLRVGSPLAFGWSARYGHTIARWLLEMSKSTNLSAWFDVKPHERVVIEPWVRFATADNLNSGEEQYRQLIFHSRLSYQIMRKLSLRLVVEYQNSRRVGSGKDKCWSVDPLLTYRLNPFSIFYIGTTHNFHALPGVNDRGNYSDGYRRTGAQFFMKLQYLFQV